ncbi:MULTISPECIES: TauD/TfdA family dioxygenase [Psychrobacter]|uniref:TauD/TfdA family dioxygenase n=1 Tax=Psychrobacter TaxID=497 RepID=UPI00146B0F3C|nr:MULTISPECIES: TauD/TfdA family dioxygenase [Psychrobacter]
MFKTILIDPKNPDQGCQDFLSIWKDNETKVVVLNPISDLSNVKDFYESLFPQLGTVAALAEDATIDDRASQRTGEVWMEIRYDPKIQNAYRHSSEAQPLHTDGSYIPNFPNSSLLCCVANSGQGGETIFINGIDVVNALRVEAPELLSYLTNNVVPHTRSGDSRFDKIIDRVGGIWKVNWNYYCIAENVEPEAKQVSERFHEFLKTSPTILSKTLAVKLKPGQAILWKDNEVLHGRNSFSANMENERFIWKCAFDVGNFS